VLNDSAASWHASSTAQYNAAAGEWRSEPAGAGRLSLGACQLRRFTAGEARACLAWRPLVMIGDSITRYQYMSLIHFLEFGEYPSPTTGRPSHPSVVIEQEWNKNWNKFFKGGRVGSRYSCWRHRGHSRGSGSRGQHSARCRECKMLV
jgi:hypothetical protein